MRHHKFLFVVAFVSGLTITAMEISASRLLAPYFGSSLYVWTNIIGIVLAALALGYYLGGKLADRKPDLNLLLLLMTVAGGFFFVVPWLAKPLSLWIISDALGAAPAYGATFTGSMIAASALFALPLLILGMTSPFIIRLSSLKEAAFENVTEARIGNIAGTVFAISTLGSLLGIFLPTLWLIPAVGTRGTISIFAALLVAVSVAGLAKRKLFLVFLPFLALPVYYSDSSSLKPGENVIYETESAYQYIQVQENWLGYRYLIFDQGWGIQSVYSPNTPLLSGTSYYEYINLLPYLLEEAGEKKQALIIGLAGGTVSSQLNYFFGGEIEIDGVEVDERVIEVAERYFGLSDQSIKVYNQDGRIFLTRSAKKYDLIFVDAYSREFYIPWMLATREFWQIADESLASGGILAINIAASGESELLEAIANTMGTVFDHVYSMPVGRDDARNHLVIASQNRLAFQNLATLADKPGLAHLAGFMAGRTEEIGYKNEAPVFTDDWAPVEIFTPRALFD